MKSKDKQLPSMIDGLEGKDIGTLIGNNLHQMVEYLTNKQLDVVGFTLECMDKEGDIFELKAKRDSKTEPIKN